MKKLTVFLGVFLFADVSDIILKIKEIENIQRKFLKIDYNIFAIQQQSNNIVPIIIKHKKNSFNLKLYAIFNNKVNINGKWYKLKDFVYGYQIIDIMPDKVILKKDAEILVLKIKANILKVK